MRLGNLFQHNTGKALNASNHEGTLLQYITTSNLYWNRFELASLKKMYFTDAEISKCTVTNGDLLVCEGGDIGRAAIWRYDYDICIQNHIHRLRSYIPLCTEFFYYLFYLYKNAGWIGGKGIGIQGLSSNAIHALLFPLPPLNEQKRIVEKLQELKPYTNKYDFASNKIDTLNNAFPEQLKKSILQEAVQGKLVPQDPADEPASALLEHIRTEKEHLIKSGKIKRDKHESVIFRRDNSYYERVDGIERCIDDEIPFEIPDSWEWVRLSSVIELQSGQDMTPDKYNSKQLGIPYITGASNIINGLVVINRWTEHGKAFAYKGNLLLTCKGTVGSMAILNEPKVHIARQIMAVRSFSGIDILYGKTVLETLIPTLKASAKSMIPGIAREDVLHSLFPLPPTAEQGRIVQQIETLFGFIKEA